MRKWYGWRKSPTTQPLPDSKSPSLYTVIPCCESLRYRLKWPRKMTRRPQGPKEAFRGRSSVLYHHAKKKKKNYLEN